MSCMQCMAKLLILNTPVVVYVGFLRAGSPLITHKEAQKELNRIARINAIRIVV